MKRADSFSFIVTFVWFGFVAAISFMEAPVKFTAPSLTLPVGLDVGRHVFAALNKAELVFSVASIILLFTGRAPKKIFLAFAVPFSILMLQTFWLLPALDVRAMVYINGGTPPPSSLHFWYVGIEIVKLVSLLVLGYMQVGVFAKHLKGESHSFR